MGDSRVAVLVAFSGDGGVENMIANLVRAWLDEGVEVDVLLIKARGPHVGRLPAEARVIRWNAVTSLAALPRLVGYLRRVRPAALLAAKDRAGRVAILARLVSRAPTRVVIRLGMHLSGSLADKSRIRRWSRWLPVRWLYPYADRIIAVSTAIVDDMVRHGRLPREHFAVLPNPVVTSDFSRRMREPVAHTWLTSPRAEPVVLAVGRLCPQKGFPTLLQAFHELLARQPARLIILGEGRDRGALEALAGRLGIEERVDLPGFVPDAAPWMARADLFVLSSAYEGSPNVLVEAMACGKPVVATDCPSGPRAILDSGTLGALVPVADSLALAQAMVDMLADPPAPDTLKAAVRSYDAGVSGRAYLRVLGWSSSSSPA